jgi:shikimate kinase
VKKKFSCLLGLTGLFFAPLHAVIDADRISIWLTEAASISSKFEEQKKEWDQLTYTQRFEKIQELMTKASKDTLFSLFNASLLDPEKERHGIFFNAYDVQKIVKEKMGDNANNNKNMESSINIKFLLDNVLQEMDSKKNKLFKSRTPEEKNLINPLDNSYILFNQAFSNIDFDFNNMLFFMYFHYSSKEKNEIQEEVSSFMQRIMKITTQMYLQSNGIDVDFKDQENVNFLQEFKTALETHLSTSLTEGELIEKLKKINEKSNKKIENNFIENEKTKKICSYFNAQDQKDLLSLIHRAFQVDAKKTEELLENSLELILDTEVGTQFYPWVKEWFEDISKKGNFNEQQKPVDQDSEKISDNFIAKRENIYKAKDNISLNRSFIVLKENKISEKNIIKNILDLSINYKEGNKEEDFFIQSIFEIGADKLKKIYLGIVQENIIENLTEIKNKKILDDRKAYLNWGKNTLQSFSFFSFNQEEENEYSTLIKDIGIHGRMEKLYFFFRSVQAKEALEKIKNSLNHKELKVEKVLSILPFYLKNQNLLEIKEIEKLIQKGEAYTFQSFIPENEKITEKTVKDLLQKAMSSTDCEDIISSIQNSDIFQKITEDEGEVAGSDILRCVTNACNAVGCKAVKETLQALYLKPALSRLQNAVQCQERSPLFPKIKESASIEEGGLLEDPCYKVLESYFIDAEKNVLQNFQCLFKDVKALEENEIRISLDPKKLYLQIKERTKPLVKFNKENSE